jgi:hypothetical protein
MPLVKYPIDLTGPVVTLQQADAGVGIKYDISAMTRQAVILNLEENPPRNKIKIFIVKLLKIGNLPCKLKKAFLNSIYFGNTSFFKFYSSISFFYKKENNLTLKRVSSYTYAT